LLVLIADTGIRGNRVNAVFNSAHMDPFLMNLLLIK